MTGDINAITSRAYRPGIVVDSASATRARIEAASRHHKPNICHKCGKPQMKREAGYFLCDPKDGGCGARFYGDFNRDPYIVCHQCGTKHFRRDRQCPNCGLDQVEV